MIYLCRGQPSSLKQKTTQIYQTTCPCTICSQWRSHLWMSRWSDNYCMSVFHLFQSYAELWCRCEGCNQIQCQDIDKYLSCPLPLIGLREDTMLRTLQSMFCNRLKGRACRTLVGLGRHLAMHTKDRIVSFLHLQISLRKFHISLTTEVWLLLFCNWEGHTSVSS